VLITYTSVFHLDRAGLGCSALLSFFVARRGIPRPASQVVLDGRMTQT
jgi:hypothetical protein